jgi:hypothetical protein
MKGLFRDTGLNKIHGPMLTPLRKLLFINWAINRNLYGNDFENVLL